MEHIWAWLMDNINHPGRLRWNFYDKLFKLLSVLVIIGRKLKTARKSKHANFWDAQINKNKLILNEVPQVSSILGTLLLVGAYNAFMYSVNKHD